ncbi:MAG TPA: hypothetical protein VF046_07005 [Gemmatimonadales bacterium]
MTDRVTVPWKGKEYEAVRKATNESAEGVPVWQVRRDGALITSFPANAGDSASEIKEKIVGWLRGNESRPIHDVDRQ